MIDWGVQAPISLGAALLNFLIGLVLSMLLAWYYESYGQSLSNRRKLAGLLPVLTLTTTLVISIIKSSLALSLGLVGALSIVRFRTAIKEPEELMFLFMAIAIGLGVGADQPVLTVMGVIILLGYMTLRMVLNRRPSPHNLYLHLQLSEGEGEQLFRQVNECLLEHVTVLDFRRLDSRDDILQLTYHLDCPDVLTLNDLISDLKAQFPVVEISFLEQEQGLGG